MNPKTPVLAALAALCLLPAASADSDPWGPDVTLTVDTNAVSCVTDGVDESVGPLGVASDDCSATVTADNGAYKGTCTEVRVPPASTAYAELDGDCDVNANA